MVISGKKIAVIVAHPDDETIGCGGVLARYVEKEENCRIVLATRRGDPRGIGNWPMLMSQFEKSCRNLRASPIVGKNLVLDLTADQNVIKISEQIEPHVKWADIVFCHWKGDMHQAHRAVSNAVELTTRPFRNPKTVVCFEIPTSTDQAFQYTFSPNLYIRLDEPDVERKLESMSLYTTELDQGRTPNDLKMHMKLRGNTIGHSYAEAFVIARQIL